MIATKLIGAVAGVAVTLSLLSSLPAAELPARVPLVGDVGAPPVVADIFAAIRSGGGNPLNMHRAVANAPDPFAAYVRLAQALRKDAHVSRPLRELAILRTLQLENGGYEVDQHTRMARSCGLSEAQIAALGNWRGAGIFDRQQEAILGWVEAMARPEGPDEATYQALAELFDPHAIVEITLTAGFYAMSARTTKALGVKPETPASPGSGGGYGAC